MSMLKVVDLLVEGCKDIANCGKLQQVGVGVIQKCYKFASAYLQGRVRIPIGGIVREPNGLLRRHFPGIRGLRSTERHEPLELRHRQ